MLGVSDEDRDEEPGLGDGIPVLFLPLCPAAGAWVGPLWEGREVLQGRDGRGFKPSFAGQGRDGHSCKAVGAAVLLRCGAQECSRVLGAAFCVMEEREPQSLTHCAKVYSARVVTSSSPPSPLFFSAHMSDYLVWETADSPLYDSDV